MNELKIKVNGVYKTVRNLYKRVNGTYQYIGDVEKKVGDSYKEFPMGFPLTVQGASPLTIPDARAKKLMGYMIYGNSKRSITIDGVEYVVPSGYTLLNNTGSTATAFYCKRDTDNATGTIDLTTGIFTSATFTEGAALPTPTEHLGVRGVGDNYIPYGYKLTELLAQNCGCVDLGTLTWNKISNNSIFYTNINDAIFVPTSTDIGNMYMTDSRYTLVAGNELNSDYKYCAQSIYQASSGGGIFVRNSNFTDAVQFKAAMSGVYLYYQRTTDASWTAPTKINAYINKPLNKLDNYADYTDSGNQRVERNVGVKVFDGTERWEYGGNSSGYGFYLEIPDCDTHNHTWKDIECTHFKKRNNKYQYYNNLTIGYWDVNSNIITFRYDDKISGSSLDAFKAWLAAQYAAGTPVTIWYPLATPTYEAITIPDIELGKGFNCLDVETEVKPSNISVNYIKRTN